MTRARAAALTLAAALAAVGLILIWVARLSADRYLYVSELGAVGEPTADVFRWAMTAVAVGAAITALTMPAGALTPRGRALRAIPPAVVLLAAAAAFGLASQVTCTRYCPLPVGPGFTWQDLVHTSAAVIGFAGASWVMLQVASDARLKRLARFSLVAALAVALIAATGGILSLLQFGTEVGGVLELVATTVALAWLVGLSLFLAIETVSPPPEAIEPEATEPEAKRRYERVEVPPAVY